MHKFVVVLVLAATAAAQQELWVEPVNGLDTQPGTFTQPIRLDGGHR